MLHLKTLLSQTPGNIVRNSMAVRVWSAKATIDADANGRHKLFTALAKGKPDRDTKRAARKLRKHSKGKIRQSETRSKYNVVIKLYAKYPKGNMKANVPAWVHCSCPYFKYYVEVADATRKSSAVITSNGNFPKIRNPRMRPYVCKHILAAAKAAMRMKPVETEIGKTTKSELEQLAHLYHAFIPGAGPVPVAK